MRVSKQFCRRKHKGGTCGGEIQPTRLYVEVRDASGLKDHSQRIRIWRCATCKHRYEEIKTTRLVDPDDMQPMVSQYSLDSARDPYKAV